MGKKEISGKCNLNTRCSSKPCQHSAHRQGNRVVRKTSCQCPHRGTSTDRTAAGKASSSGRTGSLPSLRTAQFQAIVVEGRANAHRDGQAGPGSCAAGLRSQNSRGTPMHAVVPRLTPPFTVQEAISSLRRSHARSCTGRLHVGSGRCHLFLLPDA